MGTRLFITWPTGGSLEFLWWQADSEDKSWLACNRHCHNSTASTCPLASSIPKAGCHSWVVWFFAVSKVVTWFHCESRFVPTLLLPLHLGWLKYWCFSFASEELRVSRDIFFPFNQVVLWPATSTFQLFCNRGFLRLSKSCLILIKFHVHLIYKESHQHPYKQILMFHSCLIEFFPNLRWSESWNPSRSQRCSSTYPPEN